MFHESLTFHLIVLERELFNEAVQKCKYRLFLYSQRCLLWRSVREKLVKDNKRKPKSLISRSQVSRVSQADAYFPILLSPSSLKGSPPQLITQDKSCLASIEQYSYLLGWHLRNAIANTLWVSESFTQSHITFKHLTNFTVFGSVDISTHT